MNMIGERLIGSIFRNTILEDLEDTYCPHLKDGIVPVPEYFNRHEDDKHRKGKQSD